MTTITLTIDDDRIDTDTKTSLDALPTTQDDSDATDAAALEIVQMALDSLTPGDIDIRHSFQHPDWERGDPCPNCGNDILSVMNIEEDYYKSERGEFSFAKKGDAFGPTVSILCPDCMTHLEDTPYRKITA